jgi:hypothetical protein
MPLIRPIANLKLANENRKFGIAVDYPLDQKLQDALERLMMAEWIRLIDVAAVQHVGGGRLIRLFMVTKDGLDRIIELKMKTVGGKRQ